MQGAEYLGTDAEDIGTGGRQPTGLGGVLQCGGAGSSSIQVVDVGAELPHGKGPGDFPAQGRQADYGEAAEAKGGWGLGVPTAGNSNGGGGV